MDMRTGQTAFANATWYLKHQSSVLWKMEEARGTGSEDNNVVLPPRRNVSFVRDELEGDGILIPLRHYEISNYSPA